MAELRNPAADRWDLDKGIREQGLFCPFPRGITFADQDSETEISGHWLNLEGKREGEQMSGGQWKTNCARVADGRTVLLIYGDPPYDVRRMAHFTGGVDPVRTGSCVPATLEHVLLFCHWWARWADRQPRPVPRPSAFPADAVMANIARYARNQGDEQLALID